VIGHLKPKTDSGNICLRSKNKKKVSLFFSDDEYKRSWTAKCVEIRDFGMHVIGRMTSSFPALYFYLCEDIDKMHSLDPYPHINHHNPIPNPYLKPCLNPILIFALKPVKNIKQAFDAFKLVLTKTDMQVHTHVHTHTHTHTHSHHVSHPLIFPKISLSLRFKATRHATSELSMRFASWEGREKK